MGAKLLQDVRQDLADVVQVCEGKKKQTNYLRTLINELVKGMVIQIGISQVVACHLHSKLEVVMLSSLMPIPISLQLPFGTGSPFELSIKIQLA